MKKLFFFICCFFFVLVLFGCTEQDQKKLSDSAYSSLHPCPKLPCNDTNHFNKVIRGTFGFSPLEYNVDCMECAFPYDSIEGSYTKARLDFNGQKVELYYKEGLCSKLGIDCGWEVCISIDKDSNSDLISRIKQEFCPLLKSELFDTNSASCKNEILYDTNTVQERCLGNYYETSDEQGKSFSIVQNQTTCGSSVQRGKMNCIN